jgi:hypothetical protein
MLYDNSEQLEVRHVISLDNYEVDIYGGGNRIPEGELWIKRNCVRLTQRLRHEDIQLESKPYYIFSENSSEKEDFYHALLQGRDRPSLSHRNPLNALHFDLSDLVCLIQQLHASEENLHTRWLNALIGRLFLALYKTAKVEEFIWTKVNKKIARVPKPAFISSINVQRIDMGLLPPFITNPKLKELSMDGDLIVEADISYKGNFRLDISAIARVELGTRFKAREVSIVLATILKKLDGHILLRIKPPPSNRLWITFETAPNMELSLEPIVSSRQITYGIILRAIESRIREVVNETLVFPNWDDIPFSDTSSQQFRGGIWDSCGKEARAPQTAEPTLATSPLSGATETELPLPGSNSEETSGPDAATEGASNSNHEDTTTLHISLKSGTDADRRDVGVSSATDLWPGTKPGAMRSGSFSRLANPLVDTNSAEAFPSIQDDRRDQHDVIATMRKTTKRSAPTSPSQLATSTLRQSTASPQQNKASPMKMYRDYGERIVSDAVSLSKDMDSVSATSSSNDLEEISTGSPRREDSIRDTDKKSTSSRRPIFNQSINNATTVAKKWLNSRQTAGSSLSIGTEKLNSDQHSPNNDKMSQDGRTSNALLTRESTDPSTNLAHQSRPIGRGQPLPPPGTPLPPPPKPEKRNTWVPSTLTTLTRRRLAATKEPTLAPSTKATGDQVPTAKHTEKNHFPGTERVVAVRQASSLKSSSASPMANPARTDLDDAPPSLPKRRPRPSFPDQPSNHVPNELLIVTAPDQEEGSAPTTPGELEEHEYGHGAFLDQPESQDVMFRGTHQREEEP